MIKRNRNPIVHLLWIGVLMLISIGIVFIIYIRSELNVDRANEERINALHLSHDLMKSANYLTRLSRSYVVTGELQYRIAYNDVITAREGGIAVPLENDNYYWEPSPKLRNELVKENVSLLAKMRAEKISEEDFNFLNRAKVISDELTEIELTAMNMIIPGGGEVDKQHHPAIDVLYSTQYQNKKALILWNIKNFNERIENRKIVKVESAKNFAILLRIIIFALGFLFLVVIWIINRRLNKLLGGDAKDVFEIINHLTDDKVDSVVSQISVGKAGILPKLIQAHSQLIDGRKARDRLNRALQETLEDFRRAQSVARIGSWTLDLASECLIWSEETFTIFGIKPNTNITLNLFFDQIHPDDRESVAEAWNAALNGETYDVRHRIVVNDQVRWIRERAEFERDANGTVIRAFGTCQLITRQVQAEQQLQLFASVFTSASEGIIITDLNARIMETNKAFSDITGYSREEVIGRTPQHFSSGRHGREFYEDMWNKLKTDHYWSGEIWNRRKSGDVFPELLTISTVLNKNGKPCNYIGLFTDISVQKEQQRLLEYSAYYDGLTGLPNRVLLTDRLQLEMSKCLRDGKKLAVTFIDLDGFKEVNDDYGHEAGDHVLITVANRITNCLRAHETVARLGGDEFVTIISGLASEQESMPVINRMLASIAMPISYDDFSLSVSASIGVTFYPQSIEYDGEQLLRQSDQAMYHAKQDGRNCFQIFDETYDRDLRMHNYNLECAKIALNKGEFVLYYQPKVNMATGEIIGIEALARWNHPERGILPPGAFLPDIQDTVLEIPFGEWVIDQALKDCTQLRQKNISMTISVNISARHLEKTDFVDHIRDRLNSCICKQSNRIELEILESSALHDLDRVSEIIRECAEFGISFSLDDFGTGYSSLTYLRKLPVQTLKIDQSFVRGITDRPEDVILLKGILDLARGLDRKVIAEGVETLEHGRILLEIGCRHGQGYAIARPMPFEALIHWMNTWQPDPSWANRSAWR